jgi:phenolic acid decarboxylase
MEDMHQFGTRILKDYKDRPKLYYGRIYTYRTEQDLKLYEKDMLAVASEINNRIQTGEWYRNQDNCWSYNSECPYRKICFSEQPDPLTLELYFNKKEVSDGRGEGSGNTAGKH